MTSQWPQDPSSCNVKGTKYSRCFELSFEQASYCIKKVIAAKLSVELLCSLKDLLVRHNAKPVCHKLTAITRLASDI